METFNETIYIVKKLTKSYRAPWEVFKIGDIPAFIRNYNDMSLNSDNFTLHFSKAFTDKKQADAFAKCMNDLGYNLSDEQLRYGVNSCEYDKETNRYVFKEKTYG
tara:strand:- start:257 stop:571 length:315 start_codon:yes stop_codon:yes gene_type:complete